MSLRSKMKIGERKVDEFFIPVPAALVEIVK